MTERPPFHYAFPVRDLGEARAFYGDLLGCPEGRCSDRWVDFDFRGHQIVAHLVEGTEPRPREAANPVDSDAVPIPHFGAVLCWDEWQNLADRLRGTGVEFVIEPRVRFQGEIGEQATLFFRDPSGNALEFKAFRDPGQLFARE